ncbi:MAG: leucine-rich repeat domain-containing protein [Oligoflexus sp.]
MQDDSKLKSFCIFFAASFFFMANSGQAAECEDGWRLDEESGECILNIPKCNEHEYLDQLSLSCVPKPLTAGDCDRIGLRFDSQTRKCLPKSFQEYCDDAEQSYDFVRTVSCILNRIGAYQCREAEEYLRQHKKLTLNDHRFRIGSLAPLAYLDFLEELSLENQVLSDVEVLSRLTKLKRLSLANNAISDLTPLRDLENLQYLDISANPVVDFSILSELPKLKTIVIDASKVNLLSQTKGLKVELRSADTARSPE